MWNAGGQWDMRRSHAVFGGGKGGGGGGSGFTTPTPTVLTDPVSGASFIQNYDAYGQPTGNSAQDALNAEIASRQGNEKATSDAATQATKDKAAADEQTFQTRLGTANTTGRTQVENYFRNQGLDPSRYGNDINPALTAAYNSVGDLDPNPSAAFPGTLGASILNDITSGSRTRAGNQLSSLFAPTYADTSLGYSNMDPYVSQILTSQFDPLSSQLDVAHKRGTLRDSGYNAALDAMKTSRTAAESQIRNTGQGILDKDRSSVNDYISNAKTNVGNMTQGQLESFDPSTYSSGASDLVGRELGTLGGDITSAIGNTKFADLQTLLNAGGSAQGVGDPSAINPNSAATGGGGALPTVQDPNVRRGLGTTGAF